MKRIIFVLAICSLSGCISTTIDYKTPRIQPSMSDSKTTKSALNIFGNYNLPNNELEYCQNKIFIESFKNVASQSGKFSSVNDDVQFFDSEVPSLQINVDYKINGNFFNTFVSVFTLTIIPNHATYDYVITCKYSHKGKNMIYKFVESKSSWIGLLVAPNDSAVKKTSDKEIFENISNHIIENLRKDNAL